MWLIAQIHGIADTVDKRLQRNGFDTFLPTYTDRGRVLSLYPGYAFVGFFETWPLVARVDGVVRVLGDGENPHIVQDEIIEALRDVKELPKAPAHHFHRGDVVRFKSGPWTGMFGRYYGHKSRGERSVVEVDMKSGSVRVTVRTDVLEGTPPAVLSSPQT